MGFDYIQRIPTVDEILKEMPLSAELTAIKTQRDEDIKRIFLGQSQKLLVVIGPCSADNEDSVCEYVGRLAKVQEQVKDQLVLAPRIYTNKPRTTGKGYKGMVHQPDPNQAPNLVEGLKAIRTMHIRALRESGLTAADEMLYPGNYPYLADLLSYVAIGARSVENQQHRLTVSGLDIPVGMKNPTSGDLTVMLNAIEAAQHTHVFIYNGWEVKTPGNPLTHSILRGGMSQHGRVFPNYHYEDLMALAQQYQESSLENPAIMVDVSHGNSNKVFSEQPRIALEVLQSMQRSDELCPLVKGLMIESYLEEGRQDTTDKVYGKSITDACLGWEASERLLLDLAEAVTKLS